MQANIKNDYSQKCTKATVEMPYDYDNQFQNFEKNCFKKPITEVM